MKKMSEKLVECKIPKDQSDKFSLSAEAVNRQTLSSNGGLCETNGPFHDFSEGRKVERETKIDDFTAGPLPHSVRQEEDGQKTDFFNGKQPFFL